MKISSREQIINALPRSLEISPSEDSVASELVVFQFPAKASNERLFLNIFLPRWMMLDRSAPAAQEVAGLLFAVLKNLGVQISDMKNWLYDQSVGALDRCISGDTYGNVIVASSRADNGGVRFHCRFL